MRNVLAANASTTPCSSAPLFTTSIIVLTRRHHKRATPEVVTVSHDGLVALGDNRLFEFAVGKIKASESHLRIHRAAANKALIEDTPGSDHAAVAPTDLPDARWITLPVMITSHRDGAAVPVAMAGECHHRR